MKSILSIFLFTLVFTIYVEVLMNRIEWTDRSQKERFDVSMMKWGWDINLNCILVLLMEESMIFTLAFVAVES